MNTDSAICSVGRRTVICLIVGTVVLAPVVSVSAKQKEKERTVYVLSDSKPITVGLDAVIQIQESAIAGGEIIYKVKGPAKSTVEYLVQMVEGQELTGTYSKQLRLTPQGVGTIEAGFVIKGFDGSVQKKITYTIHVNK